MIITFRKFNKNWPERRAGDYRSSRKKNALSIVIIIMVIVGELIRNQVVGWTTEKSMFHSWQTREIFDFPLPYWRTNTSFILSAARHFLIDYVLHKPPVTRHSPLDSVLCKFGMWIGVIYSKIPDCFWGPSNTILKVHRALCHLAWSDQRLKLTTHHLVSRLRMHGVTSILLTRLRDLMRT